MIDVEIFLLEFFCLLVVCLLPVKTGHLTFYIDYDLAGMTTFCEITKRFGHLT